jgi:RNA polymerase sigma factor (sigma-70 family)
MNDVLLEKLIKQYKISKEDRIFKQIYKLLLPIVQKKANSIKKQMEYYKIGKEDIQQELFLKILQIIEKYNPKEPFGDYFYTSIWNWKPKLKTEDTKQHESLFETNEEGNEEILEIEDKNSQIESNLNIEDILNECKTENEKKVCKLYLEDLTISEEDLGKILGMTHQNISLILIELRKRLKKYLQK